MLIPENNDRDDVPNVVIVITDGESNDRDATFQAAATLRETGATILTAAIGMKVCLKIR